MTNPEQLPPHLQARYGISRGRSTAFFFGILIAVLVLVSVAYAYYRTKNPEISARLQSFSVISDELVLVDWQVNRVKNQTIYCVIRAQDDQHRDVGYATFAIDGKSEASHFTYGLATTGRAVLTEILGCATSPVMRVPPANFPPGVKIPNQSPPGVAPTPK